MNTSYLVTRYLEHIQDATMYAKAEAVIKGCQKKNKNENGGELEYKSLAVSLKARLQETVGEKYWREAQDHFSRLRERTEQQGKQVQGGGTATGAAAAAGSSGGTCDKKSPKKSRTQALLLSTNITPDGLPGGWVTKTYQRVSGKSAGTKDKYYYPPQGRRFRSMRECNAFLEILNEPGIDGEQMAFDVFKSRGSGIRRSVKSKPSAVVAPPPPNAPALQQPPHPPVQGMPGQPVAQPLQPMQQQQARQSMQLNGGWQSDKDVEDRRKMIAKM